MLTQFREVSCKAAEQAESISTFDVGLARMLTEFDQNTIANMTAALEAVCKKIPADQDTHEFRARLGNAIVSAANNGASGYLDLQNEGLKALSEILRSRKSNWLTWLFSRLTRGPRQPAGPT